MILSLIFTLIIVGILLWAFNTYVTTIDPTIKNLINGVVVVLALLWILASFGMVPAGCAVPHPVVR